jgi:hypothetical protein
MERVLAEMSKDIPPYFIANNSLNNTTVNLRQIQH